MHTKFGIDEIYFLMTCTDNLLEKLHQRAFLSLDGEDKIVSRYLSHTLILISHKGLPKPTLLYRFIEHLNKDISKENYIKENTLLNEEELFSAIKSKKFVLMTHKNISKEMHTPIRS